MGELSGFEVFALAREVNGALRGTYVNNIFTIGGSQLFRFRRPGGEDVWLVASPRAGVWVSREVSERAETSQFTSKLRGELERARFAGASQFDLDRIFFVDFQGTESRRLVLELMPPGNIIVVDPQGRVTLALREVRSPSRRVVRGGAYLPPAQTRLSPAEVTADEVKKMAEAERTVGRAIGRHVALPRKYVAEALARLGLEDGSPSAEVAGREEEVAVAIRGMVKEALESPRPCICETAKGDEIYSFPPTGIEVKRSASTVSELCDDLLLKESMEEERAPSPEEGRRRELEATVARLREEAEELKVQAASAREAAASARNSTLEEGTSLLRKLEVVPLREPGSPEAVASVLYDRAKELALKSSNNLEAADKLEKRMSRIVVPSGKKTRPIQRKNRDWYEKFRWFFTTEGKLAVGGRDAQTNSALLSRHLDANDTVYHADLFGSPFFVLKGGREQKPEEVRQVAQATVAFSSAWKTGLGAADAYWVEPGQVSSAAPSGEYLARGSFAIRGKKNFVGKVIVEVAVALDGEGRVVAGPEEAVGRLSAKCVVLRPQNEKGSDTAKRVARELAGAGPPPSLDDVQRALPSGGGKIIRRK